jgi:hypothetical protein
MIGMAAIMRDVTERFDEVSTLKRRLARRPFEAAASHAFAQRRHSATASKYGGTGLGLAISKRFCQMMGRGHYGREGAWSGINLHDPAAENCGRSKGSDGCQSVPHRRGSAEI